MPSRVFLIVGLGLMALVAYLLLWPVPIRPVSWAAPVAPGYAGAHAANQRLAGLQVIDLGAEDGPEHVAFGPDGMLYVAFGDGGQADDQGNGVAVGPDGGAVFVGVTAGRGLPIKSAFQKTFGGGFGDAFITKLSPAGNTLVYSSYFGGSSYDAARAVALDATGAAYVAGYTQGLIPVKNAFQPLRKGKNDGFVAKVASNGRSVVYSSFLGGGADDLAFGIAVDGTGAAYVAGGTNSGNFPVKNPFQAVRRGSKDAFLTIVDPGGAKLLYSTFLGGKYAETGYGVALGADGAVYLSGVTNSPDLPLLSDKGYQGALGGGDDGFVFKFAIDGAGRRR